MEVKFTGASGESPAKKQRQAVKSLRPQLSGAFRRLGLALSALLWWALALQPASAQTDIRLAAGDTIAFSILGAPEFDRQITVGPGGAVNIPLAGEIRAAGLTLSQLRASLAATLAGQLYRAGDGADDMWRQVQAEEVYVDVRAYRPVYVSGAVRNAGEVPYRPGMTARQALAVAGGVEFPQEDRAREDLRRLAADRAVLIGRMEQRLGELERLRTDLDAVAAELERAEQAEQGAAMTDEGPKPILSLDEHGQRWLDVRAELRSLTASSNNLILDRMRSRVAVLEELTAASEEDLGFEEQEFARIEQLVERGVAPTTTLVDARRALLQSSARALETAGEVLRLRLDMARVAEATRTELTSAKLDLLEAIADGMADLRHLGDQVRALDSRMEGARAETAEVTMRLYRAASPDADGEPASPAVILAPGDVLEVALVIHGAGE